MGEFPGPVERYLAEIRAGAGEDQALAAADADREALQRWLRNKAFRVARKQALDGAVQRDGGWVGTPIPGSGMTVWRPVLAAKVSVEEAAKRVPARYPAAAPWHAGSVFSLSADRASMP